MNVFANTGSMKTFEALLDDYHYTMTVEWDQNDLKFQEEKSKEFINKMQVLIATESLSQQDIINVVEKKINNKEVIDALKLRATLAGGLASTDELAKFMLESSNDFYAQGASWNGRMIIPFIIVVSSLIAISFAMWYSFTHGCKTYAQTCDQFGCRNNYDVCTDYGYVGPHL